MERFIDMATQQGFNVEFRPLNGHSGLLMPGRRILIDPRTSALTQRVALAHELGHIHHRHDQRARHDRARDELQADSYAAELLINEREYAVAEVMFDSQAAIAIELGVPIELLTLWLKRRATHFAVLGRPQTQSA